MAKSRNNKLDHFYKLCTDDTAVLDVGISQETKKISGRGPTLNLFLKTFRYRPENYTGLGVQDLSGMDQIYPGKRFVQYAGGVFPFEDNEFDCVFSNAVIEHVGDDDAQVQFVNEMLRVGRRVFFTTPNKYFPVESHTNVFFLHWNNNVFYNWCRKYKPWCTKRSVYLFSSRRIDSIMRRSEVSDFKIYRNRLFGITMTFTVVCSH